MPRSRSTHTAKGASPSQKNGSRVAKQPKRRGKSLLLLECDAEKLAAQSMSMADEIAALTRLLVPTVQVEIAKTTTEDELKSRFACLAECDRRFGTIVVIGHSNSSGLCLTADRFLTWPAVARWLTFFEPSTVVLVACESGQKSAVCHLFAGIRTLREVYGPPAGTTKLQSQIVKGLLLYLLNVRSRDIDLIRTGQIINFVLTGSTHYRWLRKEFPLGKAPACQRRSVP